MTSPFCFKLKDVTNDVIKSKEIKPTIVGSNRKGTYNAYRVDTIEVLIEGFNGIVQDDYFIIELGYEDLNGDALAQLLEIDDKQYIERSVIGPYQHGENIGTFIIDDPAKKPFIFKFHDAFCIGESFWINVLFSGLAALRDCEFILRGNPVTLLPIPLKAHTTKTYI